MCTNSRAINRISIRYRFPIPNIEDLMDCQGEANYFLKIDLKSRYNQIRVHEGDEWKTTFKTIEINIGCNPFMFPCYFTFLKFITLFGHFLPEIRVVFFGLIGSSLNPLINFFLFCYLCLIYAFFLNISYSFIYKRESIKKFVNDFIIFFQSIFMPIGNFLGEGRT